MKKIVRTLLSAGCFPLAVACCIAPAVAENVFYPNEVSRTTDPYGVPYWDDSIYNSDMTNYSDTWRDLYGAIPGGQMPNATTIKINVKCPKCDCDKDAVARTSAHVLAPGIITYADKPVVKHSAKKATKKVVKKAAVKKVAAKKVVKKKIIAPSPVPTPVIEKRIITIPGNNPSPSTLIITTDRAPAPVQPKPDIVIGTPIIATPIIKMGVVPTLPAMARPAMTPGIDATCNPNIISTPDESAHFITTAAPGFVPVSTLPAMVNGVVGFGQPDMRLTNRPALRTHYATTCPFASENECNIWRTKPADKQTVSVSDGNVSDADMAAIISDAGAGTLTATDSVAAPLIARYRVLMSASHSCCAAGMKYQIKKSGATPGATYAALNDDANFAGMADRCLMSNDTDISATESDDTMANMVSDVRNTCICHGRDWLNTLFAPFQKLYDAVPNFAGTQFSYTYTDGLNRQITTDINRDVAKVMSQMAACPK